MTFDMTWDNIEIDRMKPICMFDVCIEEELKDAFNWKNTQSLFKPDHQQKVIKYSFSDKVFIRLNDERFNEDLT